MSHDGTVVAVVPVLVIRMLTTDNQLCAAALECYQEAPELLVRVAGRAVVLTELRLTLDGGARLHPALKQRGGQAVPRSQAARCFPTRRRTAAAEKEKFPRVLAVTKTMF